MVGSTSLTKTTWESVDSAEGGFDPFGMVDLGNDRLVAKKAGKYKVVFNLSLSNFDASATLQVFLRKGGSSYRRWDVLAVSIGTTRDFTVAYPIDLAVDDYLEVATQSAADSSYSVNGVAGLGDSTSYFGMSLIK